MPDRLSELVRQRALVLEHLAWLDREIANANVQPVLPRVTPVAPTLATSASPGATQPPAATTAVTPASAPEVKRSGGTDTDAILDQYRVAPATVKSDVRKGCFLYFSLAFLLLVIVVAVLYFAIGSR